ncbi:MAG: hypothetical protein JNM27_21455 [Leptospirales bacterium]|nr:hypothetical protein [Leptospirales bacterium]
MRLHQDEKRLMAGGKVVFTLMRDTDDTIRLKDPKGNERILTAVKTEAPNTSP